MQRKTLSSGGLALHRFLSNLTAVMLLTHAVLGCCAHHVHACGDAHGQVGRNHGSTAGHEHSTGHSDRSESSHREHDDCRGNRCEMVRLANPLTGKSHSASHPLLALPCPGTAQASNDGYRCQQPCTFGTRSLPVRIHLANQVLLI